MKKSIIIFSVAISTLSLILFSFMNGTNLEVEQLESLNSNSLSINKLAVENVKNSDIPEFLYEIGTRFNGIKKNELNAINFFSDYIGKEHAQRIVSYKSLSIIILKDDEQTDKIETGNNGFFNSAQMEFLQ